MNKKLTILRFKLFFYTQKIHRKSVEQTFKVYLGENLRSNCRLWGFTNV